LKQDSGFNFELERLWAVINIQKDYSPLVSQNDHEQEASKQSEQGQQGILFQK
jgi:hypothetical protein